jgi:chromosome segregation ATPase
MTESFEETAVAVEANSEGAQHEAAETLAVSMDDFSALEERVLRAVDLVKRERGERGAAEARAAQAEERAAQAEAALHEQAPILQGLHAEIKVLRSERDHVRQRVERLLGQLDGLEL